MEFWGLKVSIDRDVYWQKDKLMQLRYLVFNPAIKMYERNEDTNVYSSEAFLFKLAASVEKLKYIGMIFNMYNIQYFCVLLDYF